MLQLIIMLYSYLYRSLIHHLNVQVTKFAIAMFGQRFKFTIISLISIKGLFISKYTLYSQLLVRRLLRTPSTTSINLTDEGYSTASTNQGAQVNHVPQTNQTISVSGKVDKFATSTPRNSLSPPNMSTNSDDSPTLFVPCSPIHPNTEYSLNIFNASSASSTPTSSESWMTSSTRGDDIGHGKGFSFDPLGGGPIEFIGVERLESDEGITEGCGQPVKLGIHFILNTLLSLITCLILSNLPFPPFFVIQVYSKLN